MLSSLLGVDDVNDVLAEAVLLVVGTNAPAFDASATTDRTAKRTNFENLLLAIFPVSKFRDSKRL